MTREERVRNLSDDKLVVALECCSLYGCKNCDAFAEEYRESREAEIMWEATQRLKKRKHQ